MRFVWSAMALACAVPVAAQQAVQPKPLAPDRPYKHRPSGLTVPPVLNGIARSSVTAWAGDQLDEGVAFNAPNDAEVITVYVFRHVTGSVAVWFDRVRWQIEHRAVYGGAVALDRPAAFTPPGQATASGLMMAFTPAKGPYVATSEAMIPLGPEWYVSVRYSSTTLSPEALLPKLQDVVTALGWPKRIAPQPAADLVRPCPTSLPLTGESAPVKDPLAGALMSSMLAMPALAKKAAQSGAPAVWCCDAQAAGAAANAVYRADASTTSYLIAIGDAGRGVQVGANGLRALLSGSDAPAFDVQMIDVDHTSTFAGRDRLPPPDQALALIDGPALTSVPTWGKSRTVTVNTGASPQ